MSRFTLFLAVVAFLIVALATPFHALGVPLAPLVALALGGTAGWWVAKERVSNTTKRGLWAGVTVGLAALAGSVIGLAGLAYWIGNIPDVQEMARASEPYPEARIPYAWIAPLAALGGIIGGFALGLIDLVLSAIGGMAATFLYRHGHPTGAAR